MLNLAFLTFLTLLSYFGTVWAFIFTIRFLSLFLPFLDEVDRSATPFNLKEFTDFGEVFHRDLPLLCLFCLDITACGDNCLEVGAMVGWQLILTLS